MRLIHTADVHLDACYASSLLPPRAARARREGLRRAFSRVVERARAWPADALLIAGDLFVTRYVRRDTLRFVQEALRSLRPIPVFIAPGNHDPFAADSPYPLEVWPENVYIFSEPRWTSFSAIDRGLTVHGFAFDGPEISVNPFGSLEVPVDGSVHVALAHGTERNTKPPEAKTCAPFDAEQLARPGLAYGALGHFHQAAEVRGNFGTKLWYSGAPEPQDFDEPGIHGFLEVEIEGGEVSVKEVPCAEVVFTECTLDCSGMSTVEELVARLQELARQTDVRQVAHVTLTGTCRIEIVQRVRDAIDRVFDDFEYLRVDDATQVAAQERHGGLESVFAVAEREAAQEAVDAPTPEQKRVALRVGDLVVASEQEHILPIRGLEGGGLSS